MEDTVLFSVGKKKAKLKPPKTALVIDFWEDKWYCQFVGFDNAKRFHINDALVPALLVWNVAGFFEAKTLSQSCLGFTKFFVMLLNSCCDCFSRLVFVAYDSVENILTSIVSEISLRHSPPTHRQERERTTVKSSLSPPTPTHPWVREWTRLTSHTGSLANGFRLYRLPKAERSRATGNETEQTANITIVPFNFFRFSTMVVFMARGRNMLRSCFFSSTIVWQKSKQSRRRKLCTQTPKELPSMLFLLCKLGLI